MIVHLYRDLFVVEMKIGLRTNSDASYSMSICFYEFLLPDDPLVI